MELEEKIVRLESLPFLRDAFGRYVPLDLALASWGFRKLTASPHDTKKRIVREDKN